MTPQQSRRVNKYIGLGYDRKQIQELVPGVTDLDLDSAFKLAPKTTKMFLTQTIKAEAERNSLTIQERSEEIAKSLEGLIEGAIATFTPEEVKALTPRERILLISNFTEKMRLLRGESTENIEAKGLIGHILAVSSED